LNGFEVWFYRGSLLALLGLAGTLVAVIWKGQEDRQKDQEKREADRQKSLETRESQLHQEQAQRERDFYEALDEQRQVADASLKEFRKEFMDHLDKLRASNDTALAALNQTMAEVARTAGEIRARMAEKYASKEALTALEERIEKRFEICQQSCPPRCGQ
jgi:hypothetical protein